MHRWNGVLIGDRGLIASVSGAPVGGAWLRRFTADDHGYGYVDDSIPGTEHRGRTPISRMGIGRCLLAAILAQSRLDEIAQISLSVETDNPARRLYEPFGFRDLETVDGAVTMIATLQTSRGDQQRNPTSPMAVGRLLRALAVRTVT